MTVLAIDPGYEVSAWVLYDGKAVLDHAIETNNQLLNKLGRLSFSVNAVVLEQIESFGMAVGREVFETVFWTGRFFQAVEGCAAERMPRRAVKVHLCQSARAQDSNVRVALIDRFGGSTAAKGNKSSQGPLYGIKKHEWAALAIAVTWWDQQNSRENMHAMP